MFLFFFFFFLCLYLNFSPLSIGISLSNFAFHLMHNYCFASTWKWIRWFCALTFCLSIKMHTLCKFQLHGFQFETERLHDNVMINTNLFFCLLFLNRTILCSAMHDGNGNDNNQSIHLLGLNFRLVYQSNSDIILMFARAHAQMTTFQIDVSSLGIFVIAHVSMSALTSDQISCTQIKSIGFFSRRSKHIALSKCSNIEFFCTPLYLSLSSADCQIDSFEFRWKNTVIEAM